jgi:hypothetical protein
VHGAQSAKNGRDERSMRGQTAPNTLTNRPSHRAMTPSGCSPGPFAEI